MALDGLSEERLGDVAAVASSEGGSRVGCAEEVDVGEEARGGD